MATTIRETVVVRTVQTLLDERELLLIGRAEERQLLHACREGSRPVVVFVHGLAGIGKTTLLRAFAQDVRADGGTVVQLDCQRIEPTERGFLAALSEAVGDELVRAEDAGERLSRLDSSPVLILENYEVLRLLDSWVRQRLVPALSVTTRLLTASRDRPNAAWGAELGGLFRALPLSNLSRADTRELLAQHDIGSATAERIYALTRGHPMSVSLAASALADRPGATLEEDTAAGVADQLARLYLDGLDPRTRDAVGAASLVRRPTVPLLAEMLPEQSPQDTYERLRALPFVEHAHDGLIMHETVRDAVAHLQRSRDPEAHRAYRRAAWRRLRRQAADAAPAELWRSTADMLFLIENPLIREGFFPESEAVVALEPAQPVHGPEIAEIARATEPSAAAAIVDSWWRHAPRSFTVARNGERVQGFCVATRARSVSQGLVDADPVLQAIRDHERADPVPPGSETIYVRRLLARDTGERPSAVQGACWLDVKRSYLELRPALRRVYGVTTEIDAYREVFAWLGFVELPASPTRIGGAATHISVLDFGPSSVDGWLATLVAKELLLDEESLLDPAQRQLVLDGRRVDLSRLEFDLLEYLARQEDVTVPRTAILRDVWGTEYSGGSNVIEAVVSSLRRKLGEQASRLETARGVGYRFRSTARDD